MFDAIMLLPVIATVWAQAISENKRGYIVETDSGPIIGEESTFKRITFKAFTGVPYARPPLGDLRFKAPQPPDTWTHVRDATKFGKPCTQPKILHISSEDCLTLNVYTPSLSPNELMPVIVWIHGGGFQIGDGSNRVYGPEFLVQQNIVVVTINYRLGALGFLATGSSDATGNWGLKDQVAALKWVQANIAKFGGDTKQVTIYGESAGGASVHLHLFSPLSKGLFQKAIISSASAINNGFMESLKENEINSRNLAHLLGASDEVIADPEKRVEFLRKADSKEIIMRSQEIIGTEDPSAWLIDPVIFKPVIEAYGAAGAFLTQDPKKLLARGKFTKVPLMMGMNDFEGSIIHLWGIRNRFPEEVLSEIEENICMILPKFLADAVRAKNGRAKVTRQIKDVYFNGEGFTSSWLNFTTLWGDIVITNEMYLAERMHAQYATESNPLYNYYFTFDGEWNMVKKILKVTLPGAAHIDELTYVFLRHHYRQPDLPDSSPESITKDRMISFISNFVKKGNPTPSISDLVPVKWEASNKERFSTMFIGNELKMEKEFLKSRMDLWDQIYKTYCSPLFASKRQTLAELLAAEKACEEASSSDNDAKSARSTKRNTDRRLFHRRCSCYD